MLGLAACLGWLVAGAMACLVLRLRRRLELVARAEHELRGPLTAFGLALDAARGTPAGRRLRAVLDAELARARAGLTDLAAARAGARAEPVAERVRLDRLLRSSVAAWEPAARARGRRVRVRSEAGLAVVNGDRSRIAQALGNVISNAVEHGSGDVSAVATRSADRVRVEVTNATAGPGGGLDQADVPDRGRGLEIAAEAAADAGGSLSSAVGPRLARTILDFPVEQ
jgi:signal transduction histidine kinase